MDDTAGELGSIQLAIDSITQKIAGLGLSLAIEQDFAQLRALLAAQGTFANPTYDPADQPAGAGGPLLDAAGRPGWPLHRLLGRAAVRGRHFSAAGRRRLWYEHGFTEGTRLAVRPLSQRVGGRVGHSGRPGCTRTGGAPASACC